MHCGLYERCHEEGNLTKCVCDLGFVRNVTGSCVEIHSCDSADTNTCHPNATCFDIGAGLSVVFT